MSRSLDAVLPSGAGSRPFLAGVAAGCLAVGTLVLPAGSTLRFALTLPLLCFLPGYALTTALFPATESGEAGTIRPWERGADRPAGLSIARRAGASLGFSLVLVPIAVLAVAAANAGINRGPILVAVLVETLGLLAIGWYRRGTLVAAPPGERYRTPTSKADGGRASGLRDRMRDRTDIALDRARDWADGGTVIDTGLNVAIAVSLLLVASMLVGGIVAPGDDSSFTEFSVMTEGEDGQLVSGNYSATAEASGDAADATAPLVVSVVNREDRSTAYGVAIVCQQLGADGTVTASTELTRTHQRVAAGDTWRIRTTPDCSLGGERVRLAFLLYRGDLPASPSTSSAYRSLTLWIETPDLANGTATPSGPSRERRAVDWRVTTDSQVSADFRAATVTSPGGAPV